MSNLEMSAAPLSETLQPAAAYVTIVMPYSRAVAALRQAHEYAATCIDATVTVTAADGSVIERVAWTQDGAMPRPSVCTSKVPSPDESREKCPTCARPFK